LEEFDLHFEAGADFLAAYQEKGFGELFVDFSGGGEIPDLGKIGDTLAVNMFFSDRSLSFRVHMRLLWRRPQGAGRLSRGVGLGFLEEETQRRDMIVGIARGDELTFWLRQTARHPARVAVRVEGRTAAEPEKGPATRVVDCDISLGGIRIPTELPRRAGDLVHLRLAAPGALLGAVRIDGRVAWSSLGGVEPGMGIEFIYADERQRRRIEKLVEKVRLDTRGQGAGR